MLNEVNRVYKYALQCSLAHPHKLVMATELLKIPRYTF